MLAQQNHIRIAKEKEVHGKTSLTNWILTMRKEVREILHLFTLVIVSFNYVLTIRVRLHELLLCFLSPIRLLLIDVNVPGIV